MQLYFEYFPAIFSGYFYVIGEEIYEKNVNFFFHNLCQMVSHFVLFYCIHYAAKMGCLVLFKLNGHTVFVRVIFA